MKKVAERKVLNRTVSGKFYCGTLVAAIFIVLLCPAPQAGTGKIALIPLEDISLGANGVNLPLTRYLSGKLRERGEDVIPLEETITHMAGQRIRWLGYLDSANILAMRRKLGADLVLFGTVSELTRRPAALGLVLTAVETEKARTIWTESGAVSTREIKKVLGLDEPKQVEELQSVLVDRLLQSWSVAAPMEGDLGRPVVKSCLIKPRCVKPGDEVRCAIRLFDPGERLASLMDLEEDLDFSLVREEVASPKGREDRHLLLMVGNDDYLPMEKKAGNYYEAVWPAPDREGTSPVTLILKEKGREREVIFLGNYRVDKEPPDFRLKLKAVEVDGRMMFNKSLPIIPVWNKPEPLSRWTLDVLTKKGRKLVNEKGKGNPPNYFRWRGVKQDGYSAPDGEYDIVFRAWDRAGNLGRAESKVTLKADRPALGMSVRREKEHLRFSLACRDHIPVAHWTGRFYFADGETVLEKQGYSLPVELNIPLDVEQEKRPLMVDLTVRDILGNRTRNEIGDLRALLPEEKKKEEVKEQAWLEEF